MNRVRANVTIEAEEITQYRIHCEDCGSGFTTHDQEGVGWWILEHAHQIQSCCNCDAADRRDGNEEDQCGCECHDGVDQYQESPEQTETVGYVKELP